MSGPTTYRVKAEVEAWRVGDGSLHDLARWCGGSVVLSMGEYPENVAILLMTTGGQRRANHGDWVIRGTAGEFFIRDQEYFRNYYEAMVQDAR